MGVACECDGRGGNSGGSLPLRRSSRCGISLHYIKERREMEKVNNINNLKKWRKRQTRRMTR